MKAFASLMSLVFIILVIVFDAARLKKEHSAIYQARMGSGPATWGVLTFLFSLLVLPVYLFSRNKYFLDYRALPLEERQVAGTNSFLKTCLSAKIIILWFLIVESVSLAIVFTAHRLGASTDSLTQKMDINLIATFFFYGIFLLLAWFAAREYPSLGFKEIFDLRFRKLNKFKAFIVPLFISLLMALVTVILMKVRVTTQVPLRGVVFEIIRSVVVVQKKKGLIKSSLVPFLET